jgi:FkbM family methyltransferase
VSRDRAFVSRARLQRVKDSARLLGFANTAKFLTARIFDLPLIRLRPPGHAQHFWVRTRDSDFLVFLHVFGEREMDVELPVPPRLIVDAGAYVGYSTCYYAQRYPTSKVVAIEPVPANADLLEKHCTGLPQVTIERAALWPKLGTVAVHDPGERSWGFQMREAGTDTATVPTITIPEILRRTGEPRVSLLKLDIEGAEEALFRENAEEWLSRVDVILVELHGPACTRAMEAAIAGKQIQRVSLGEKVLLRWSDPPV